MAWRPRQDHVVRIRPWGFIYGRVGDSSMPESRGFIMGELRIRSWTTWYTDLDRYLRLGVHAWECPAFLGGARWFPLQAGIVQPLSSASRPIQEWKPPAHVTPAASGRTPRATRRVVRLVRAQRGAMILSLWYRFIFMSTGPLFLAINLRPVNSYTGRDTYCLH